MTQDQLQRFIFTHHDCRGEIVSLGSSYRETLANGNYAPVIKRLLGEFLAAASLLSATLKFDGILTLQARGDGAVPLLVAEANHQAHLRGIARTADDVELPEQVDDFRELLGHGHLVVTIEPDQGERYQSVIPLAKPTLAGCLEDYFALSEQLPTRFWLSANEQRAAGFLLQRLPQQITSDEKNADYWQHISTLASSVQSEEMLSLDHQTLLYRLFHQEEVKLFEPTEMRFRCTCSKERTGNALVSLGADEVTAMLAEQDPINIDCQFCNVSYTFDEHDVAQIFKKNPTIH